MNNNKGKASVTPISYQIVTSEYSNASVMTRLPLLTFRSNKLVLEMFRIKSTGPSHLYL